MFHVDIILNTAAKICNYLTQNFENHPNLRAYNVSTLAQFKNVRFYQQIDYQYSTPLRVLNLMYGSHLKNEGSHLRSEGLNVVCGGCIFAVEN